jgi:hypothetical protein
VKPEEVAAKTGMKLQTVKERTAAMKALRANEKNPEQTPPATVTPKFSPTGGPPKLQNELRKRGL